MSRPLAQGPDIIMQDIVVLNRIIRRVMKDPKRYPQQRESLVAHLKGACTILLNGERAEDLLSKNTEVASVISSPPERNKRKSVAKPKR